MMSFIFRLALAYLAQNLMERINPTERYFETAVVEIVGGDEGVRVLFNGKPRKRPWRPDGGHIIRLAKKGVLMTVEDG